ncbi:MAG: hypothetical protein KJO98_00775 [Rhodothermia bacterium]|nr:hypothetical protein [Rhodothermia bacterium]
MRIPIASETYCLRRACLARCVITVLITVALGTVAQAQTLQRFTPSTMLAPRQIEVKLFNNLYTQTSVFDEDGERVKLDTRSSYFTSILQAQYGLKKSLNVGFDLYFKSVHVDVWDASAFDVLSFRNDASSQTALTVIGPRVKMAPFKRVPSLSLQGTLLIPVASDMEGRESGRPFLEYDDPQIWLQAFYDYPIDESYLLYLETGILFRPDNTTGQSHEWTFPLKGILNFYPTGRWTVYGLADFSPSSLDAYYFQGGVGVKFQVFAGFEVETLLTGFPIGRNRGGGKTYNFGLRWIRF